MTDTAKGTVLKLLADLGTACAEYQDEHLRALPCKRVQVDEIWSFCYAKAKNVPERMRGTFGVGDVWTFTALCADTKLVPSWLVGPRDAGTAIDLMTDLADRLANRVQLTTDGHKMYLEAVETAFGAGVDYAMLVKIYGADPQAEKRYSPAVCLGAESAPVNGTRTRSTSPPATSSGRTSRCGWACGASPGSPTPSPRSWRTWSTRWRSTTHALQLRPDSPDPSGLAPPWRRALLGGCGPSRTLPAS
jgi:hypothetical protein